MLKNINHHIEKKVTDYFGNAILFEHYSGVISLIVSQERLLELVKFLNDDTEFRFTMLIDIFAVDYPDRKKRFEVNYCLLSVEKNYRVNLKLSLSDDEKVPSLHGLYKNSVWLEREVWDMHGVKFENNPDLRRILTDYGFEGHPLRKDFPLTGYKEVRYDMTKGKVVYEPVSLVQEYRDFDFISPWEGIVKELPGDEKAEQELIEDEKRN